MGTDDSTINHLYAYAGSRRLSPVWVNAVACHHWEDLDPTTAEGRSDVRMSTFRWVETST